jgi:pimeloyl-ACP methyl ester carboxylesterase
MNEPAYREAEAAFWATVDLTPKEHFVRLPTLGTTVRVQDIGEGDPTLFLHGGPNTGSTWVPILPHLTGFRCLVLDRPGTGLSEPYRITADGVKEFASILATDVLDALGVDAAHVVASSLGGYIAIHSVGRSPDRYRRMVQMAAPAMLAGQTIPGFMRAIFKPGMRHLIGRLPPNRAYQEKVLREIGHDATADRDGFPEGMSEWYFQMTKHTDTQRNDFDTIHAVRGRGGSFNPACAITDDDLARVSVPTHFIWGLDDAFGSADAARRAVAAMPEATLELLEASGHLPWIDDPEFVGRRTAEFLMG